MMAASESKVKDLIAQYQRGMQFLTALRDAEYMAHGSKEYSTSRREDDARKVARLRGQLPEWVAADLAELEGRAAASPAEGAGGIRWRRIGDEPPPVGEQIMLLDALRPGFPPHAAALDEFGQQKTYLNPPPVPTHWVPLDELLASLTDDPQRPTPEQPAADHTPTEVGEDGRCWITCSCGHETPPRETRTEAWEAFFAHRNAAEREARQPRPDLRALFERWEHAARPFDAHFDSAGAFHRDLLAALVDRLEGRG